MTVKELHEILETAIEDGLENYTVRVNAEDVSFDAFTGVTGLEDAPPVRHTLTEELEFKGCY